MESAFKGTKTLSKALGKDKLDFFPALERCPQEVLKGVAFRIDAAKIVDDWDGQFGSSSFVLAKITLYDSTEKANEFTTLLGGKVVVKQVRKLIAQRSLPIVCTLATVQGQAGEYYQLQDPPEEGGKAPEIQS